MKRVVTIQDVSCFGKCSITVALPIISAAGIELTPLPNIVLSTHTGGFVDIARRDMDSFICEAASQWESLGLEFDAIYIGYLGSGRQFEIVSDFISRFRRDNTIVVVDPVMGDGGKLYSGITRDFPQKMAELCSIADYIVPNITEAHLMLGKEQESFNNGPGGGVAMLDSLAAMGSKNVIITSIEDGAGNIGAAYRTMEGKTGFSMMRRQDGNSFHGAGDTFASCVVAALMNGKTLEDAIDIAVKFTARAIAETVKAGTDLRFGLRFEPSLPYLIELINKA
jgi:Pyridoxal/pyridoxine/pyridoxamine kinase